MHQPINNWSQVVTALSQSTDTSKIKAVDNMRKLTYRNALQKQIIEHNRQIQQDKGRKQKQKQKITAQTQQENIKQVNKKMNKITKQQWYQLQNLDLIKLKQHEKQTQSRDSQTNKNQFNKLEDEEKQRKIKTRRNFEIQNLLNNKQSEIHNKYKSREKQLDLYEKQMYNSYIQEQYRRQQSDRELWRNKYLYDKSIKQAAENHNYRYAYRAFLKRQIEEKQRKQKYQTEKIDEKLKSINQSVDKIDSSPAYLGLVNQSFDRRRQLSLIDKHLQLDQKYVKEKVNYKIRGELQSTEQKAVRGEYSHRDLNSNKSSIAQLRKNSTAGKDNERYSQQKQIKHRQFTSYDFITGTHKTFLA